MLKFRRTRIYCSGSGKSEVEERPNSRISVPERIMRSKFEMQLDLGIK